MSEILPTHQRIVADEYWDRLSDVPKIPFESNTIDGFSSVHMFAQLGASKVQELYRHALRNGHLTTPVNPGDELPIVERGQGLVRVVMDARQFPTSESLLSKWWNKSVKNDTPEHFDALAQQMQDEHLYSGESARITLTRDRDVRNARIWRAVYYLTGSKSGSQLEGISGNFLFTPPERIRFNSVVPPLVVGEAYRRNKAGTLASKVVAAEVLIPGGARRRVPKKALFNVKPRFAFNI